jgi:hypothetical protein
VKYTAAGLALATTLLAASPAMAATPLDDPGVSFQVGGFSNGYVDAAGGGLSDTYAMYVVGLNVKPLGEGLLLDVDVFGHTPTNPQGAQALGTIARVGWAWDSFALAVGVYARYDFIAALPNVIEGTDVELATLAVLPSLTLDWTPGGGPFGAHLGLVDRADGGSLARLGVSWGGWGVSYLALAGAEVFGAIPVGDALEIDLRAYGTTVLSGSYSAGASAGATWRW